MKSFDFTEDELAQIHEWYQAAAGESSTRQDTPEEARTLLALLQKLGFDLDPMDESAIEGLSE